MGGRGAESSSRRSFSGSAKVPKIEKGKANPNIGTEYDSDSNYLTFKLWEKGEQKRIYVTDYKRRTVGHIDVNSGQIETEYSKGAIPETIDYFLKHYSLKKIKKKAKK